MKETKKKHTIEWLIWGRPEEWRSELKPTQCGSEPMFLVIVLFLVGFSGGRWGDKSSGPLWESKMGGGRTQFGQSWWRVLEYIAHYSWSDLGWAGWTSIFLPCWSPDRASLWEAGPQAKGSFQLMHSDVAGTSTAGQKVLPWRQSGWPISMPAMNTSLPLGKNIINIC